MEISYQEVGTDPTITILTLSGELDSSCYLDVIEVGKQLYEDGSRNLLVDLSGLTFMASSGLISLHNLAYIMRGSIPPNAKAGWRIVFESQYDLLNATEKEKRIKLLSPQPRIAKTLKMTGFDNFLEIFSDQNAALESFKL